MFFFVKYVLSISVLYFNTSLLDFKVNKDILISGYFFLIVLKTEEVIIKSPILPRRTIKTSL